MIEEVSVKHAAADYTISLDTRQIAKRRLKIVFRATHRYSYAPVASGEFLNVVVGRAEAGQANLLGKVREIGIRKHGHWG